ncbi:glycoside hydrolase family 9 protein [Sphingobacterium litopenaei]|uniref:Glycoside hydrolase family 9 protein n=1 Tax=Sphingobacterium litopenaei TaxID=2763500 RepID=A0ABR7YH56_9SPHI|nr:glycoside hydrolase family 9 protein [Sphingobacterium litopenaei]MBD1430652.1 glycoside hydrolase family 9 protein [Sphingobacterium litopenaei]
MKKIISLILQLCIVSLTFAQQQQQQQSWIRINQLGYLPESTKVLVWVSKTDTRIKSFTVIDAKTNKSVYKGKVNKIFGKYGPFDQGARLDISAVKKEGTYIVKTNDGTSSAVIKINKDVYKGSADYALRYMRQQRTLFNPYLKDSCHTHDGFTMYASSVGLPDSTHIDAGGGWHDASDYLQYSTTSANATFHLLAAYRDFPQVFSDEKQANGLDGNNGIADVLDEAKWGLDWLLKMHPKSNMMFNQIADDRDHSGYRLPGLDSLYGRGHERPVYFIDGKPQQRGKFMNNTKGTSSTAAKLTSAFALGYQLLNNSHADYAKLLKEKAKSAYDYAHIKPGVTQTVSVKSPYIYAEDNWVDDMELAEAMMYSLDKDKVNLSKGLDYARQEPVTPWMIRDTANHYQYYPFINLGHYELAKLMEGQDKQEILKYYKDGIEYVWNRARENMFYRGVPYIWCSNNLTTSFAIQAYWYKKLTGDAQYQELEQANFDWLFGVNPWGTSMVVGLPADGDTPVYPHSSFTYLHNYTIDGGLVDGPVYARIYNNLIGIQLLKPDGYAEFQSDLVVYHDDFGDYSTNEPTMDGTASLIYLLSAKEAESKKKKIIDEYGAVVRGNLDNRNISLVFTGDEFRDGLPHISHVLEKKDVGASFFVTGKFLEDKKSVNLLKKLAKKGHYIGPHSDKHLLYSPWENRDSLLLTKMEFVNDLEANVQCLGKIGIERGNIFIAPYEWYNKKIVEWSTEMGFQVYNFTPGLRTPADYTYPEMGARYMSSFRILNQLHEFEKANGLNGYIILIHLGTDSRRTDKLYLKLEQIIDELRSKKYNFVSLENL